jgi:hypothetical protein
MATSRALIAWIDQALGRPTEREEHRTPTGLEDLEFMSEEQLERLVAEGRARRLERIAFEREHDDDSDPVG